MVTQVTSYGRSGVSDWLIQRVSSLILALYSLFIVGFILTSSDLDYATWAGLFERLWMKAFTFLALISVAAHAWIGLWVVLTDYVTERFMGPKALALRIVTLLIYGLVTFTYLVWGIQILWGTAV